MTDKELRELEILAAAHGLHDIAMECKKERKSPISELEYERELLEEENV